MIFVGGSGPDTIHVSDAQLTTAGTSLNGGTGASNTLVVETLTGGAADVAALTSASVVTGFSILNASDSPGLKLNAGTGGLNNLFNHFQFSGTTTGTITNLPNNATVDLLHTSFPDTFAPTLGATNLNLKIGSPGTPGILTSDTVTGWRTIVLSSNGTGTNIVVLTNSDATAFTITGSENLKLTLSISLTTVDKFDASGLTGGFTLTTDSEKNDIILTGSGTTKIFEAPGATGTSGDNITYLAGHTAVDTLTSNDINNSGTAGSQNIQDVITNFALNQHVLKSFVGTLVQGSSADMTGIVIGTGLAIPGAFASSTAFIAAAEATTTATAKDVVGAVIGGNTWLAEFFGAGPNDAHIVELVGVSAPTAISTAAGAGHILIA